MTKLTDNQARLLTRARAAETGIIPIDDHPKTVEALISRGFIVALENEGGKRELQITDAGRDAIAPDGKGTESEDHESDGVTVEPPASELGEAVSPPPPARRRQVGALVALDLGAQVPLSPEADGEIPGAPAKPETKAPKGKTAALIAVLRQADGVTVEAMMAITGWQAHSVRGCLSGAIKKGFGLEVTSEKTEAGRVYRIVGPTA